MANCWAQPPAETAGVGVRQARAIQEDGRERPFASCLVDLEPAGLPIIVPDPSPHASADAVARLMLVALSLAWGLTWPVMRIALDEIPPFSFRIATSGLAALALFAIALAQRRNVRIKRPIARLHLVVAGFLNVGVFTLGSAFAQLATTTSR